MDACTADQNAEREGQRLRHHRPCYAPMLRDCGQRKQRSAGCSPLGLVKWTTLSSWKMFTSSMPGMAFTPRRFSVFCSRLSSVDVVLCTAFFFLRDCHTSAAAQTRAQPLSARHPCWVNNACCCSMERSHWPLHPREAVTSAVLVEDARVVWGATELSRSHPIARCPCPPIGSMTFTRNCMTQPKASTLTCAPSPFLQCEPVCRNKTRMIMQSLINSRTAAVAGSQMNGMHSRHQNQEKPQAHLPPLPASSICPYPC